ncbi:MAG: RDD family protein [Chloroflexi bacterium]|nr:RDD family protein [Chloroflexota bacterium]MYC02964.1 RDD family protein [Chloroflexota bacterium]MYD73414.1 RDD family protein [Chloroflexota bacterium]
MTSREARTFVLECDVCHRPAGPGSYFCSSCDVLSVDPHRRSYAATRWSRLGAFALDYLIIWLTVGVGWLIWLAIVAPRGQSPGKSLLGLHVIRTTGVQAATRHIWLREFGWDLAIGLIAVLLLLLLGAVASTVGELFILWFWLTMLFWAFSLFDAAWVLWDRDRQTLHDKVLGTLVVERTRGGSL